jgi:hypothetical protein
MTSMINVIEEVRECIRFLSLSLSLCVVVGFGISVGLDSSADIFSIRSVAIHLDYEKVTS